MTLHNITHTLLGFSWFQLVFMCKVPDIWNLAFPPLEQFASSHKHYLQLLKEEVELIAGILLDCKSKMAQAMIY